MKRRVQCQTCGNQGQISPVQIAPGSVAPIVAWPIARCSNCPKQPEMAVIGEEGTWPEQ